MLYNTRYYIYLLETSQWMAIITTTFTGSIFSFWHERSYVQISKSRNEQYSTIFYFNNNVFKCIRHGKWNSMFSIYVIERSTNIFSLCVFILYFQWDIMRSCNIGSWHKYLFLQPNIFVILWPGTLLSDILLLVRFLWDKNLWQKDEIKRWYSCYVIQW